MNTTTEGRAAQRAQRTEMNRAAATAASGLVPAPAQLNLVDEGQAPAPGDDFPAFMATFNGARSGDVVLILHPEVTDALTQAAEDLQLADAVQPALQAAAESLGPCVLGPVAPVAVTEVNARRSYDLVGMQADGQVTAWLGVLPREETASSGAGPAKAPLNGLNLLRDVEMTLSVEIGRARMTVRDLLALSPGTVVELDRAAGAPADLLVNGRLIARGEVVVVDEDFGLRITEIVQPASEATT